MGRKCTATVMVADPKKPSEDIEKPCGKDAEHSIKEAYLCEKHYQEWKSNE